MKYEFHVGDYVENNYGKVGYITSVKYTKSNKDVFYDIEIVYYNADIVGVFHGDQSLIQDHFNRIGQYDFTKTEQPKEIKRLPNEYGYGYVLYKGMTPVDGIVNNGWVSIGELSDKINELVDAVNELRNK